MTTAEEILDDLGVGSTGDDDSTGEDATLNRLGQILTRDQLSELPPVEPLISEVLSRPSAAVLVGGYGLGKTALAMSFGLSVATGEKWLGHDTVERKVLYVVGEGGSGLDARVTAWESAWYRNKRADNITFAVKPESLANKATWFQLTQMAVAGEYGFVILDTFSSLAPDADETKDAALMMRHLSDLSTAINGTTLLVHHPGWSDSSRVRGGYQFEANADEVLLLTGVNEQSDLIQLTRKKVKDGPDDQTLWLRRKADFGSVYIEHARPDDAEIPMRDRILAMLGNYGDIGATGPQLLEEAGVEPKSRSSFYKALRKLQDEDLVNSRGKGNAQRYYLTGGGM